MYLPTNATGWSYLYDGDLIGAAFTLYNTTFGNGWVIFILFMLFQSMLWFKTRSMTMLFATGMIFLFTYAGVGNTIFGQNVFSQSSMWILCLLLVFEGAGTLYEIWWK